MKEAINFLVMIALMLTSLTTLAQDAAEPSQPVVVEEAKDNAETLPTDTNQLIQDLLMLLQQKNLRDPFAPDSVILKEQRRANNEFIEVGPGVNVPEVSLVGVVSTAPKENAANEKTSDAEDASDDEKAEVIEPSKNKVASIRVEGRVYFVREGDRVTLTRSSGNLVIEISAIENGFVEVKLGTLAESVIIR